MTGIREREQLTQKVARRLSHSGGFTVSAIIFGLFLVTSTVPSPMYRLYQENWHFSAVTLTLVFAVYAAALLLTLLFFGRLSDHLGRRPLILAAIVVTVIAVLLFLFAQNVSWLYAARVLQGVGAGIATATIPATLIDLQREGSGHGSLISTFVPSFAMAVGAIAAAALVEYGPDPTHLVWIVLLGLFILAGLAVFMLPEPILRRAGVLRSVVPKIGVATKHVGAFAAAVPGLVAVWALGAFILSLGPALAATVFDTNNLLLGGIVIFLLTGLGALASLLFRNVNPQLTERIGIVTLFAGSILILLAILAASGVFLLVAVAVAGGGWGVAYLGMFRSLIALANPSERAGMVSSIYIVAYLAMSIPAVLAGIATSIWGLESTAVVYIALIAILAVVTSVSAFARHRRGVTR
jgi:MFS family permease